MTVQTVDREMNRQTTGIARPGQRAPVRGSAKVVVESIDESDEKKDFCKGEVSELSNTYPTCPPRDCREIQFDLSLFCSQVLKVMVPSHASCNDCKWIYPITFGGGLVGGDVIEMNIHVKKGCRAVLTGQESTKIYHCPENLNSSQTLKCQVDDEALLCILSDPVVCYRDAIFHQKQFLRMSSSGNLVYLDWMIGGRVALDELWQFKSYHNRTDILVDEHLVYRDNYHLTDTGTVSISQAMGNFQVQGSCIILGSKLETVSSQLYKELGRTKTIGEKQDADLICSVSQLKYKVQGSEVTGIYIRFLASSSSKAYQGCISYIVKHLQTIIGGNPFDGKYK